MLLKNGILYKILTPFVPIHRIAWATSHTPISEGYWIIWRPFGCNLLRGHVYTSSTSIYYYHVDQKISPNKTQQI